MDAVEGMQCLVVNALNGRRRLRAGPADGNLVVRGSWPILTLYTVISMLGLLFTGAYILKGIKKVLHGPLNEHWAHGEHRLTEINTREILVMVPLMALILWIGVWPAWILNVINNAVVKLF